MTSTRKPQKGQAPIWLNDAVYEPKRQRTIELVKQAVDTLVGQRKQDGVTRISLTTIVATAKQQDPAGQGIAHTSILENEEAYAYYKRFRTASKPKKRQPAPKNGAPSPVIKADRDQVRVRQRYLKLNRGELVDQLLSVEQQYVQLHERYLAMNDKLLGWQLRAEQAEEQLKIWQEQSHRQDRAHGIRNEIIEEIEKREKICHLKRKDKHKGIAEKGGCYESYHIVCCHDPDFTAVGAINAVMVRRSSGGGSLFEQLRSA